MILNRASCWSILKCDSQNFNVQLSILVEAAILVDAILLISSSSLFFFFACNDTTLSNTTDTSHTVTVYTRHMFM